MASSTEFTPAAERLGLIRATIPYLESQALHFIREAMAAGGKPVLLYSIGKDSTVLLHLARKAFWPAPIPFPVLHVDTTWKFAEMIAHRERTAAEYGLDLRVFVNAAGVAAGTNPFTHGSAVHTDVMKTQALRQALAESGFNIVLGGARRDEEPVRAKERVFSHRDSAQRWDPRRQRPEPWHVFNTRLGPGESLRVFPLSNWSELDVWVYLREQRLPVVPLYFAKPRRVVRYGDMWVSAEERGLPGALAAQAEERWVRFRTLGCWPLSGAIESRAATLDDIIDELLHSEVSERAGRAIDRDQPGSMEIKKREGYF